MKLLSTTAVLASVAAATYNPCPSDSNKHVKCCAVPVFAGIALACRNPIVPPTSREQFSFVCGNSKPKCCGLDLLTVADASCIEPAEDPAPPAYNPCPDADQKAPGCCKRDLLDNINCKDGTPATPPTSFEDFKAQCKAADSSRAYCCRTDDTGAKFGCSSAKDPNATE